MPSINPTRRKLLKKTSLHFLLVLPLFALLLFAIMARFYREEKTADNLEQAGRLSRAIAMQQQSIFDGVRVSYSDLAFLANQNELARYLDTGEEAWARAIENEYRTLMACRGVYDQIRLLDITGMEKVRVNYNGGAPSAVEKADLQDKSSRYYYTEVIDLDEGGIYLSPLDLNEENGAVNRPLKPTIRLATPVFNTAGQKCGLLVLNYLAADLLESVDDHGLVVRADTHLVNSEGFWLLSPDPEDAWGFMLEDRVQRRFSRQYPEAWRQMMTRESGSIHTVNGTFEFTHVHPFGEDVYQLFDYQVGALSKDSDSFWVLIHHIPQRLAEDRALLGKYIFLGALVLLILLPGVWAFSYELVRRKVRHARIASMAMHDELTGLYNRRAFNDHLKVSISQAERYGRKLGVLYIDLDGFKEINDTHGHGAGDELLVAIARRLRQVIRKSDVAARLGGDEFACILTEITKPHDALLVGQNFLATLEDPVSLNSGEVRCHASVGAAVYPDNAEELDSLIGAADRAMYQVKFSGKNRCALADMPTTP